MASVSRIGIVGKGNVGQALERGLGEAGYEVRAVGKEPEQVREVGGWAELVILAVPYPERQNALRELGDAVQGKPLVDVTNALGEGMSFTGDTKRSGAEQVQEWAPEARVVKAFNTVFAHHMDKGQAQGEPLTLFVAGDDEEAKEAVLGLGDDLGFEPVDAGALENARWLEPLGYLNITLAYKAGLGPESGFRYLHAAHAEPGEGEAGAQRPAGRRRRPSAEGGHADRRRIER